MYISRDAKSQLQKISQDKNILNLLFYLTHGALVFDAALQLNALPNLPKTLCIKSFYDNIC